MKSDLELAAHIIEAIAEIQSFLPDGGFVMADRKTQLAVLHLLQNIGDSIKKISDTAKQQWPDVPWRKIAGFRDVIVHDYLGDLDYEIVQTAIDKHLGGLLVAAQAIYATHHKPSGL
jgi:uncharacterized protein with HEPN domain